MVRLGSIKINTDKINLIAAVICTTIRSAGFEAYIVGGCVRDLILEREPKDWDICTNAKPEDIMGLFSNGGWQTVPTGIKHGTVTVVDKETKQHFEVTTYRIDGSYSDGRHPDTVEFTSSLEEDLSRRDFTINAMALGFTSSDGWKIVDPFNGIQDIVAKSIRCVGGPGQRFSEDGLRILRAIRFCCQLGFSIESKTLIAMRDCVNTLSSVSSERVRDELVKIIMTPMANSGVILICQIGAAPKVLPHFDRLKSVEQSKPWHVHNVFDHTMVALHEITKPNTHTDLPTRLAVLFHDIGKLYCHTTDENGIHHFYGHPIRSAGLVRDIMEELRFDNDTIIEVFDLVLYHDNELRPEKPLLRRMISKFRYPEMFLKLIKVRKADILAQNPDVLDRLNEVDKCLDVYTEIIQEASALKVSDLAINGYDMIECGFTGVEIGIVLKELLELVIDEVVENDKTKLLALAKFRKKGL